MRIKGIAFVIASVALMALPAAPALAHTSVRDTSIAENAELSTAPGAFTVTFSGETGLASVTLTDATGRTIALDYTPPRTMASSFTIPLPTLTPGAYTIAWRTMSRDGHAMPGAIHFTVAA